MVIFYPTRTNIIGNTNNDTISSSLSQCIGDDNTNNDNDNKNDNVIKYYDNHILIIQQQQQQQQQEQEQGNKQQQQLDSGSSVSSATTTSYNNKNIIEKQQNSTCTKNTILSIDISEEEYNVFTILKNSAIDAGMILQPSLINCYTTTTANTSPKQDHHDKQEQHGQQEYFTIRVAGGWVRDKLLVQQQQQQKEQQQQHRQKNGSSNNFNCTNNIFTNNTTTNNTTKIQIHDIDIVVNNNISGVQMATWVHDYITKQNVDITTSSTSTTTNNTNNNTKNTCSRIGIINANPNQSKHLQTATMRLNNTIDIDFNQLRGQEVYDSNSTNRIPSSIQTQTSTVSSTNGTSNTVLITPYDDCIRRDFTCNSLYYNICTCTIEDYTQRGINDLLYRRIIQTPVPDSIQTFVDDPLRILRAIRFSVRYNMKLSSNIISSLLYTPTNTSTSASTTDIDMIEQENNTNIDIDTNDNTIKTINQQQVLKIHTVLIQKVSRERIGKELEEMLSGKFCQPLQALQSIYNYQLMYSIFVFPTITNTNNNTNNNTIIESISGTILNKYIYYESIASLSSSVKTTETTTTEESTIIETKDEQVQTIISKEQIRTIGWDIAYQLILLLEKIIPYFQNSVNDIININFNHTNNSTSTTSGSSISNNNNNNDKTTSTTKIIQQQQLFIDQRLVPLGTFLVPFRNFVYTERKVSNNNSSSSSSTIGSSSDKTNKNHETLPVESGRQQQQNQQNQQNQSKKKAKKTKNSIDTNVTTPTTIREYSVVSNYMIKESIKFTNKDVLSISIIMSSIDRMIQYIFEPYYSIVLKNKRNINDTQQQQMNNNDDVTTCSKKQEQSSSSSSSSLVLDRVQIGLILRDAKDLWLSCYLISLVVWIYQEEINIHDSTNPTGTTTAATIANTLNTSIQEWVQYSYDILYIIIIEYKLDKCWLVRPLIDGKSIQQLLFPNFTGSTGSTTSSSSSVNGPLIGIYLQEEIKYMLQYPLITKDELQQFLLQTYYNST